MNKTVQLSEFGNVLVFIALGIVFVGIAYLVTSFLSKNKPNPEKLSTYECGEESEGSAHSQFNVRFYIIALVFLLFDVEIVFLFPWATVFGDKEMIAAIPIWGWLTFIEMIVFISILLVGLVYVWIKGDLNWIKPNPGIPSVVTAIPASAYNYLNDEKFVVVPFNLEPIQNPIVENTPSTENQPKKPAFRPQFLKK